MRGSRGGVGAGSSGLHSENSQTIGVLRNTGPDSLKNYKANKPAFSVGLPLARQRNAMMACFSGI